MARTGAPSPSSLLRARLRPVPLLLSTALVPEEEAAALGGVAAWRVMTQEGGARGPAARRETRSSRRSQSAATSLARRAGRRC